MMTERIRKISRFVTLFLISFILFSLSLPAFAGASETEATPYFERDSYGLPIRNHAEDLPAWYPEDIEGFVEYHDYNAPRVVDIADIFTDSEEEAMREKINGIIDETGYDVVIYTDSNTYGFNKEMYCYDFYDFCGYGLGDEFSGMILFVCMNPNDRGWVATATGDIEDDYTEDTANEMDDQLYNFMAAGKYGEGVLDWIDNVYTLYTTGSPFWPEWFPEDFEAFERSHNPESPRIYDDAGLLSGTEKEDLELKQREIAEKYGIDAVVHTTAHSYGMNDDDYADCFYYYNGYGLGENYDGILLTVFAGEYPRTTVKAYGAGESHLTEVNYDRLLSQTSSEIEDHNYGYGMKRFLNNVEHMERTGRVNKTAGSWFSRLLLALGIGAAVGGISLYKAKSKMETVRAAFNADSYLNGIKNITPVEDSFIDEKTTRTKIVAPVYSSSSHSSSSSGRSTYHSHSHGSSGRSHTSSSRRF